MLLALPRPFKKLNALITQFNSVPEKDAVQRLFYLQKISTRLNRIQLNTLKHKDELFNWLYDSTEQGFHHHLKTYKINPDAAFFLKNIQFIQAIAEHSPPGISKKLRYKNEFDLLQQRDTLLAKESFEESREQFSSICRALIKLINRNDHVSTQVKKHIEVLEAAKAKFAAIRKQNTEPSQVHYNTRELGEQVNNFNFKFTMTGWDKPFVFRVEDSDDLNIEQQLYSYPVSKYFAEDFGCFMWGFEDEKKQVEYKPVFLCQYADQGNVTNVAKALRGTNPKHFAAITSHYFNQLTNFCLELIDAKFYHPDIKLSNFLIHGNRIIVSDRKTLINTENCTVSTIRSTPNYAPKEYLDCLGANGKYNSLGFVYSVNLPQFMAYQLGMALKEFLILTQQDEISFEVFRDPNRTAADYFKNPDRSIVNLSALINELTREDASKRISIAQMRQLLPYRNHPTPIFYQEIEKILPASALGIQTDIEEMEELIKSPLKGAELLAKANLIFNKLNESESPEPRLCYLAKQLASKTFKNSSYSYFSALSKKIEGALLDKDWALAPWYRKIASLFSFGYFRVTRKTKVDEINLNIDFRSEEFKTYGTQLKYVPRADFNALGNTQANNFTTFVFDNLEKITQEEKKKKEDDEARKKADKAQVIVNPPSKDSNPVLEPDDDFSLEDWDSGTVIRAQDEPGKSREKADISEAYAALIEELKNNSSSDEEEEESDSEELSKDEPENKTEARKERVKAKRVTFGTFRSTMFRGDGNLPVQNTIKPRPSTKEIVEPIIDSDAESNANTPSL